MKIFRMCFGFVSEFPEILFIISRGNIIQNFERTRKVFPKEILQNFQRKISSKCLEELLQNIKRKFSRTSIDYFLEFSEKVLQNFQWKFSKISAGNSRNSLELRISRGFFRIAR